MSVLSQFSFVVLLWNDSIVFFKSIYFLNFALMIATFVLDALLPRPKKSKKRGSTNGKAATNGKVATNGASGTPASEKKAQ